MSTQTSTLSLLPVMGAASVHSARLTEQLKLVSCEVKAWLSVGLGIANGEYQTLYPGVLGRALMHSA